MSRIKKVIYFILASFILPPLGCGILNFWNSFLPDPSNKETSANWSPDGQQLVYVCYRNGPITGWSQYDIDYDFDGLGSTEPWATYTEEAADICLINRDGSNFRPLVETSGADLYPVWSPDGTKIAYTHDKQICLIHPDGTNSYCFNSDIKADGKLSWHPDNTRLLFKSRKAYNSSHVSWLNITDGNQKDVTKRYELIYRPHWMNQGKDIFFTSGNDYRELIMRLVDAEGQEEKILYKGIDNLYVFPLTTGEVYFKDKERTLYKISLSNNTEPILVKTKYPIPDGISPSGKYAIYNNYTNIKIVDMKTQAIILQHNTRNSNDWSYIYDYNWSFDESYLTITISYDLGIDNQLSNTEDEAHIYIFDIRNKTTHQLISH